MRARVLTFRYVGALLVVAGLLVAGQTVIHQLLVRQEGDARVINLAGRQRMLGQRLCTLMLALTVEAGDRGREIREELARTADDWERNQAALRDDGPAPGAGSRNSERVRQLFAQIEPEHRALLAAARAAVALPRASADAVAAQAVRARQDAFLAGMDRIVAAYEGDAERRVIGLRRLELILLALALLVLVLDGVFVFRPAMRELRRHLADRELVPRAVSARERAPEIRAGGEPAAATRLEHELVQQSDRDQLRLAQDLHDGPGQHLIAIGFLLRPLRAALGAGHHAARLDEIHRLLGEAIAQTRDLVRSLHSPALEAQGLAAALGELSAYVARVYDVACRVHDRAGVELALPGRTHLHRIAREAVINAARHARATAIDVELARDGDQLVLVVRDDGTGLPAGDTGGMGLALMGSRARMLGASLEFAPRAPAGTTVTCRVPLSGRVAQEDADDPRVPDR